MDTFFQDPLEKWREEKRAFAAECVDEHLGKRRIAWKDGWKKIGCVLLKTDGD